MIDKFQLDFVQNILKIAKAAKWLHNIFPIIEGKNNQNISLEVWKNACKKESIVIEEIKTKNFRALNLI